MRRVCAAVDRPARQSQPTGLGFAETDGLAGGNDD